MANKFLGNSIVKSDSRDWKLRDRIPYRDRFSKELRTSTKLIKDIHGNWIPEPSIVSPYSWAEEDEPEIQYKGNR
jgi:hypothetical protein